MGGAVSSGRDNSELVDNLMGGKYIRSAGVERVFRALDRGDYMTRDSRDQAYKDLAWRNGPLHLSAPCIYSEVMEGLELRPGLSFLNVGSGTGYLSTLAGLMLGSGGISHGVEVVPAVLEYANKRLSQFMANSPTLDELDFCEPRFYLGNGLCLAPPAGYDRVYCGAACPDEYENYFKHLIKVGGILVMPLNDNLVQVRRVSATEWASRSVLNVSFAALRLPSAGPQGPQGPQGQGAHPPVPVTLDELSPVRLCVLARACIREAMRGAMRRRHPEVRDPPPCSRPPAKRQCPRRICIPVDDDSDEGLNALHDLDRAGGAHEMNALLSLVLSMGTNRAAGALRVDMDALPSDSDTDTDTDTDMEDNHADGGDDGDDGDDGGGGGGQARPARGNRARSRPRSRGREDPAERQPLLNQGRSVIVFSFQDGLADTGERPPAAEAGPQQRDGADEASRGEAQCDPGQTNSACGPCCKPQTTTRSGEATPSPSTSDPEALESITRTHLDSKPSEAETKPDVTNTESGSTETSPKANTEWGPGAEGQPPAVPSEVEIYLGKGGGLPGTSAMEWDGAEDQELLDDDGEGPGPGEGGGTSQHSSEEETNAGASAGAARRGRERRRERGRAGDSGLGEEPSPASGSPATAAGSGSSYSATPDTTSPRSSASDEALDEQLANHLRRTKRRRGVVRSRSSSAEGAGTGTGPGGRRERAAGASARRVRLSVLMKRGVKELPLPHELKRYVNYHRCYQF